MNTEQDKRDKARLAPALSLVDSSRPTLCALCAQLL